MKKPDIILRFEKKRKLLDAIEKETGAKFDFDVEEEIRNRYDEIMSVPMDGIIRFDIPKIDPIRLAQYQEAVRYYDENAKNKKKQNAELINKQGTLKQTTLAFHYMREAKVFPRTSGSHSTDGVFVNFLTGKNKEEVRKILGSHLKRNEKSGRATKALIKDLEIVKAQFKEIQFFEGIMIIEKDIKHLENDLDTFNE